MFINFNSCSVLWIHIPNIPYAFNKDILECLSLRETDLCSWGSVKYRRSSRSYSCQHEGHKPCNWVALCALGPAGGTDDVSVVLRFCPLFWSNWGLGGKAEKAGNLLLIRVRLIPDSVLGRFSLWWLDIEGVCSRSCHQRQPVWTPLQGRPPFRARSDEHCASQWLFTRVRRKSLVNFAVKYTQVLAMIETPTFWESSCFTTQKLQRAIWRLALRKKSENPSTASGLVCTVTCHAL